MRDLWRSSGPPAGPPRASCPVLSGAGLVGGFVCLCFGLFVASVCFWVLFVCFEYDLLVLIFKSSTGGALPRVFA